MTPRKVNLRLGKMTYSILTPLSDAAVVRVQEILDLVDRQQPDRGIGQENLLLLACLHLAYALDVTTEKLDAILQKLESELEDNEDKN